MKVLSNAVGWLILTLLAVSVLVFLASMLITAIRCYRNKQDTAKPVMYLVAFGGIFVLVLISLGLLVSAQLNSIEGGNVDAGTFISLISLSLSLAAIIPFFVTKALTERDIETKVDRALRRKEREIDNRVNDKVTVAESRLHTSDADISRMVAYLLVNETPDYYWSLSWLARAVKARKSTDGDDSVNRLFRIHTTRLVVRNLCKIKAWKWRQFSEYEAQFECNYTGAIKSEHGTLARLLVDYMFLVDEMTEGGIFCSISEDNNDDRYNPEDLKTVMLCMCSKIIAYLAPEDESLDNLASGLVCRKFRYDRDIMTDEIKDRLIKIKRTDLDGVANAWKRLNDSMKCLPVSVQNDVK